MRTAEVTSELSGGLRDSAPVKAYETALIPYRTNLNGPLSTARQRRLFAGYAALYLLGCLLFFASGSASLATFGAGLVFPGGGFVAVLSAGDTWMSVAHFAMAVASLLAFGASLLLWHLTGNVLAPFVAWLGIAALAPAMGHHEVWRGASVAIPGFPLLLALVWTTCRRIALARGLARREVRNEYLARSPGGVTSPVDGKAGLPVVEELSEEDLAQMRFVLDRSLQPVADFGGFNVIDQFQTSALRYQLANMSYALSLASYCRVPALRGYLSKAQVNLIEKMKDPRVWRYWRLENAWGNLRLDGDPMAPRTGDNIMYSAWYAAMIALYQSTSGDRRYDEPGSITLEEPGGRQYRYDHPTLVNHLYESMSRAPFCLVPCEPNFIYPMCNNYGVIALKVEDRLHGTARWAGLEGRYDDMLRDEFTTVDGGLVIIRSDRTGFALPLPGYGGLMFATFFLHAVSPGVARRGWEIVRNELLRAEKLHEAFALFDQIDIGNYRPAVTSHAPLAACAVEMGDRELAERLLAEYDVHNPPTVEAGVLHRKNASTSIHAVECLARVGRVNGLKDCVERGMPEAWLKGAVLEEVRYPELLVARAVSDGENLETVLYPGREAGSFEVTVAQLAPDRRYRCEGAASGELRADGEGRARLTVRVDGRSPLSIAPIP